MKHRYQPNGRVSESLRIIQRMNCFKKIKQAAAEIFELQLTITIIYFLLRQYDRITKNNHGNLT